MSESESYNDSDDSDVSEESVARPPIARRTARRHRQEASDSDSDESVVPPAAPNAGVVQDDGFVPGWHCPTTDRGPLHGLKPMGVERSKGGVRGPAKSRFPMSPFALFKLFFTDVLLTLIINATNSDFVRRIKRPIQPLSMQELLRFLAITISFGINRQPQVKHYWRRGKFRKCYVRFDFQVVASSLTVFGVFPQRLASFHLVQSCTVTGTSN